jgi:DNA-binding transcriptional regulator YiaG
MTLDEYRAIRERFGYSAAGLARILGISDGRQIRRHEAGDAAITGPISRLMRLMARFPAVRRWLEAEAEHERRANNKET